MTKSRKRILLSSIAMLLVALIALGSATFAWFTVSKSVTADTMQVKVIAQAGLEITNTTNASGWTGWTTGTKSFSAAQKELFPVSMSTKTYSGKGYIPAADATSGNSYNGAFKKATTVPSAFATGEQAITSDSYFAVYKVAYRSAGTGSSRVAHTGITATVDYTDGDASNHPTKAFARVALLDSTGAVVATFGTTETTPRAVKAGDPDTTGTLEAQDAFTVFGTGTASVASTDDQGTAKEYTLVVWYEGHDSDCVDANKDGFGSVSITFTYTD